MPHSPRCCMKGLNLSWLCRFDFGRQEKPHSSASVAGYPRSYTTPVCFGGSIETHLSLYLSLAPSPLALAPPPPSHMHHARTHLPVLRKPQGLLHIFLCFSICCEMYIHVQTAHVIATAPDACILIISYGTWRWRPPRVGCPIKPARVPRRPALRLLTHRDECRWAPNQPLSAGTSAASLGLHVSRTQRRGGDITRVLGAGKLCEHSEAVMCTL